MFLVHGGAIIEPVEIRHALQVGLVFEQLLGAAVKQADMAVDTRHDLAIKVHDHAEHTVRSRVLRAEVQRELALVFDRGVDRVSHYSDTSSETAFSSPGISWVSLTGS